MTPGMWPSGCSTPASAICPSRRAATWWAWSRPATCWPLKAGPPSRTDAPCSAAVAGEAMATVKADETRQAQQPDLLQPVAGAPEGEDVLTAARPDRLDQPPAVPQLFDQRGRHLRKGRGDDDRVVRSPLRHALAAVTGEQYDVVDPLTRQIRLRPIDQFGPQIDAHDVMGQLGQQGGLEAEAGTDLQHMLPPGQLQAFDHPRRQRRLGGHLPMRDREGRVDVGLPGGRGGHE